MGSLTVKILAVVRWIIWWIDSIGFEFIDNAYEVMIEVSKGLSTDSISAIAQNITRNCYMIVGIFALFRIAVFLIQSIIDPDKLTDKKAGASKYFINVVITLVLFIVVPIAFNISRKVQKTIMDENTIPKLLTGVELKSGAKAGETLQLITLKAIIHPDNRIGSLNSNTGEYSDEGCNNEVCKTAVNAWNEDRMRTRTIAKFIDEYTGEKDDYYFIYDYIPFLPLVIGLFMTYILLSFTIDIAVRTVELAVLEILSPLFIVTYVDPKSSTDGPFKKWLGVCTKTYLSLFIKIAIFSLMLLLISNMENLFGAVFGGENGPFIKLIMIIAILIFAKKAPKWIGDLTGVETGAGLGGLGIRKKLEPALSKPAALGIGAAVAANKLRQNHKQIKANRDKKITDAYNEQYGKKYGRQVKSAKEARKALKRDPSAKKYSDFLKSNGIKRDIGVGLIRDAVALGSTAKDLKGIMDAKGLSAKINAGKESNLNYQTKHGINNEPGLFAKAADNVSNFGGRLMEKGFGNSVDIFNANESREKREKYNNMMSRSGMSAFPDPEKAFISKGDVAKAGAGNESQLFAYAKLKSEGATDIKCQADGSISFKNAAGEVKNITAEQIGDRQTPGSYAAAGAALYSPEGIANMQQMQFKEQSKAISQHSSNNERITELTSQMGAIETQTQSAAQNLSVSLEGAHLKAEFKSGDLTSIRDIMEETSANIAQLEQKKKNGEVIDESILEKLTSINDNAKNYESFCKLKESNSSELSQLVQRQEELKTVIDSTKVEQGNANMTTEELIDKLNIATAKKEKEIKALEEHRKNTGSSESKK